MLTRLLLTLSLTLNLVRAEGDACGPGCLACDPQGPCTECDLSNYYFLLHGICAKASVRKCLKITANGKCAECLPNNYIFRNAICTSVIPIDGCTEYDPKATSTICLKCDPSLLLYQNTCLTPINRCLNYDIDTGLCIECAKQFRLSLTWKQCLRGAVKNCDYYDTIGYCVKCNDVAPRLAPRRIACFQTVAGCALHSSSQDVCLVCEQGMLVTDDGRKCLPEVPNCIAYGPSAFESASLNCQTCRAAFVRIEGASGAVCKNVVANCQNFDAGTKTCIFCKPGFVRTDDKILCLPAIDNCAIYEPSSVQSDSLTCKQCSDGFKVVESGNQCFKIPEPIQNCSEINQTDYSCTACGKGFQLRADNQTCLEELPNCEEYSPTTSETQKLLCKLCSKDYSLTANHMACAKAIPSCLAYSDTSLNCTECTDGSSLSSDTNRCLKNIADCVEHNQSGESCTKCADGLIPTSDEQLCLPVIAKCALYDDSSVQSGQLFCQSCESGLMVTDDLSKCLPEITDCLAYLASSTESDKLLCSTCAEGFELSADETRCVLKIENCLTKDETDDTKCANCNEGFVVVDGGAQCLEGIANCAQYKSLSSVAELQCQKCAEDFEVFVEGRFCAPSIKNCLQREDVTFKCTQCDADFVNDQSGYKCLSSIPNCQIWEFDTINSEQILCTKCMVDFILAADKQRCDRVIENCAQKSSDGQSCLRCEAGQVLTSDALRCLPAIANCSEYEASTVGQNRLICNTCKDKYELANNNQLCVLAVEHCDTRIPPSFGCTSCADGLVLTDDGLKCLPPITECFEYASSDVQANALRCATCSTGLEPVNNGAACATIIKDCQERSSNLACSKCSTPLLPTSDGLSCLSPISNCKTYASSTKDSPKLICSACDDNYVLSDGACVVITTVVKIDHCTTINSVTSTCSQCAQGYHPNNAATACLKAIDNCDTYATQLSVSGGLVCQTCARNYNLEGPVCVKVGLDNCLLYSPSSDTCSECEQGFAATDDAKKCLVDIDFCIVFATSNINSQFLTCKQCLTGFIMSSDSRGCFASLRNCKEYEPATFNSQRLVCKTCDIGYRVQSNGSCARKVITNCRSLSTTTGLCTACITGFVLTSDGEKCLTEIYKCATYAPSTISSTVLECTACQAGATLTDARICYDGKVAYCATADPVSGKCLTCDRDKLPTSDGLKCLDPVPSCMTYAPSSLDSTSLSCSTCKTGYQVFNDGQRCALIVDQCARYDPATFVCAACNEKLQVTTDGAKCLPTIDNCLVFDLSNSATTSLKCLQCTAAFVPDATGSSCIDKKIDNCTSLNTSTGLCDTCETGFRQTDDKALCLPEVPNCRLYRESSRFSTGFQCLQCRAGYQLFAIYCIQRTIPLCDEVDETTGNCRVCSDGYRPTDDGQACLDDIENCAELAPSTKDTDIFTCNRCNDNSFLVLNGADCAILIDKCIDYEQRDFYCNECAPGFTLTRDQEKCLPSIPNCDYYVFADRSAVEMTCMFCADGYNLRADGKACNLATPAANTSAQDQAAKGDNSSTTVVCQAEWRLTDDKVRCLPEISNCTVYGPSNLRSTQNVCLKCADGFGLTLNGEACV